MMKVYSFSVEGRGYGTYKVVHVISDNSVAALTALRRVYQSDQWRIVGHAHFVGSVVEGMVI